MCYVSVCSREQRAGVPGSQGPRFKGSQSPFMYLCMRFMMYAMYVYVYVYVYGL
jgi:hypothetical protein